MRPLGPAEPRTAGRYRLLASLGEGGMGRVSLALSPDGRFAALKQIHPEFAADPKFRGRFRHEVEASRKVSGAYTAAVLDADVDAESPWLASVYVPGPDLRAAVDATGPLPVEALRYLAVGLTTALADIHRAGLVHRDLKPSNVLLAADGPRVIDFGIARAAEISEFTGTGAIVGTPAFMSPEQASSGVLTAASDVFSFGAVLVMAATGQSPFIGDTTAQTLYNIVHTRPDLTGLSPEIAALVEPCLAKDPARRPTPLQVLDWLGPVPTGAAVWPAGVGNLIAAADEQVRAAFSSAPPVPPPPPQKRSWQRTTMSVAGVLVLAAAATAGMSQLGGAPEIVAGNALTPKLPVPDALSETRLRDMDPCRVLDGVEVDPIGKLTPALSEEPTKCSYDGPDNFTVWLDLGADSEIGTASGRPGSVQIAGLPVRFTTSNVGCGALVQTPAQPKLSIEIDLPTDESDACGHASTVLRTVIDRLQTNGFLWRAPADSAFVTDPCSLVDDQTARAAVGDSVAKKPYLLHQCEWQGSTASMSVSVTQGKPGKPLENVGEPVKIDGTDAYSRLQQDVQYCTVTWTHRQLDKERTEIVTTKAMGTSDPCASATRYAKAVLAKLSR
ncbi:hypothetical protein GCM10022222_29210 [Amycolatopsis ultiminotia]|uniref:Protein kinase domain-containing protein n=1 Tax=Amycolatopsis ultiminotia TaxID=543629 RepID=A0ABP6W3Q6_9PSEU